MQVAGCDVPPPADAGPAEPGWVLESSPAPHERQVPRAVELHVVLDRVVLPRSVNRNNVRLESGAFFEFVYLRFDPVTRSVVAQVDVEEPLQQHTAYDLVVDGLVDLDGNAQPEEYRATFWTDFDLGEPPASPSVPWSTVATLFAARCASSDCHGPSEPRAGLDLSSGEGVRRTALGVLSRQFPSGSLGEAAPGALSLSGLPIVDAVAGEGNPARSYLIYKVLGEDHILGAPMPPDGPGLDDAELAVLRDWILSGAPTR